MMLTNDQIRAAINSDEGIENHEALEWLELLLDRLKLYEDFDASPDDADWESPHPIFLLTEERDAFMKIANERATRIKELKAENDALDFSWEQAKQRWHKAEMQLEKQGARK